MTEQTLTMRKILPWWGRLAVVESAVDDEQRESGLIIPLGKDAGSDVKRGVIVSIDDTWRDDDKRLLDLIPVGTPVYWREQHGVKIGDVILLEPEHVLAYEGDDE